MDVQLVFSRHAVDLRDGIVLMQDLCDLRQIARCCLDFKIAEDCAADLLGIDNGRIFLNNSLLLQSLYPGFYCDSGDSNFITNIQNRNCVRFLSAAARSSDPSCPVRPNTYCALRES